jgi:hypothetical protein
MSKFGDAKSPLDPRFPFSVEPGGSVINLANKLSSLLVYDPVSGIIKNLVGGQLMQGVGTLDINRFPIAELFGAPYAWRTSKVTTGPNTIYGHFVGSGASSINHFSTGMTLSFWFRNNNTPIGAPPTGNLQRTNKVIVVSGNSLLNFNVEPQRTKFAVYNVTSPDGLGEELAFGFNNNTSGGTPLVHTLTTRDSRDYLNNPHTFESFGWGSVTLNPMQKPITLGFQKWHHIVIAMSAGDSFTTSGRQIRERTNQGYSAVYVNGVLVNRYIGGMEPGVFIKGYGTYPFESLSPDGFVTDRKSDPLDKLWFAYDSATNNRHYTQFCTWDRVLSTEEVEVLYFGTRQGVHTQGITNVSQPPRKPRNLPSRVTKTVNIGFDDSPGPRGNSAYDDSRSLIGDVSVTLGSNNLTPGNYGISYNANLDTDLKGVIPAKLAMESVGSLPSEFTLSPFSENLSRENLVTHDGTEGTALIRIPINSVTSSRNLQIAGRTDSAMAKRISNTTYGSLFLSSAFKDNPGAYIDVTTPGKPYAGIAGTGFLYYSPQYSTWLEKRSTGNWAFKLFSEKTASERNDAVNSIEVNARTLPNPGLADVLRSGYGFASGALAISYASDVLVSSSIASDYFVTGVNETLAQFSASPQIGYFLPFKESLEHLGYHSIGTPTVTFGAPFAPKYHAYDHETIKLGKYIDRPFRLKKVILRVPVKVVRKNEVTGSTTSESFTGEWANNVPARKDMDNYVFFLYRQRRSSYEIDSTNDVSASVRFLIASSSVCVYNSPSFGRAFEDGFSDIFGQNTPISASTGYSTVDEQLNSLYSKMNNLLIDPLLSQSLTRWDSPLHGPSVAIDAQLDNFGLGAHTFEKSFYLEAEMTPAVVLGGNPPATLTYLTSSTTAYSTSFFSVDKYTGPLGGGSPTVDDLVDPANWAQQGYNRLFNRYPYTGSYLNLNASNTAPPITSIIQNQWVGGTRQPKLNNSARGSVTASNQYDAKLIAQPYFSFIQGEPYTLTQRETYFNEEVSLNLGPWGTFRIYKAPEFNDPCFDIELGRTGMSVGDYADNIFKKPFPLTVDGRSVPGATANRARGPLPGVFQRTNLIRFMSSSAENLDTTVAGSPVFLTASQSSIGTMSGSNMADLVSSMTVGFFTASPNTNKQIVRDYILLPSDELILGLDAGITPPPDVTPTYDDPHPDALGGIDPILEITVP